MLSGIVDCPDWAETFPCRGRAPDGQTVAPIRTLAQETAVAMVYNGTTDAVMMATPADLEDFAFGFSFNEGLIGSVEDVSELTIAPTEHGIELRMWLRSERAVAYHARRRHLAGPTGCGLCGIESLSEAMRPLKPVAAGIAVRECDIADAVASLATRQILNHATHAVHAAGYYRPGRGMLAVREDIGRHNALDKLSGALSQKQVDARHGLLVITSRISVEMVQKAAMIGAPVLIAISAPTALAVRAAESANMTLVGVARGESYQVFCRPDRIDNDARALGE